MKIIVDAMGGDNAPLAPVRGCPSRSGRFGRRDYSGGPGGRTFWDCLKKLGNDGPVRRAWRSPTASEVVDHVRTTPPRAFKDKPDSSLTVGLNLLQGREGRRLCLRRLARGRCSRRRRLLVKRIRGIRRAAHGPRGPHGQREDGAHRLRRHGRVHAGVPAAVCLHGLVLRRACPGPSGEPQGGPAEHRGGGEQGHWSCRSRPTPC